MMHWMALLPASPLLAPSRVDDHADSLHAPSATGQASLSAEHLAWWALQFTPRVALLSEAVVMEIHASERLFGGPVALRQRITREARELGVLAWAHASTALAALALARHAAITGPDTLASKEANTPTPQHLDALPLHVLPGVAAHQATLARLGCRTLGDVRRLPRGGLSRRFGAALLLALDQACGHAPETFAWVTLPPVFDARLALPGRVESAPALLFASQRLLTQLCAWLAGRQAGITAFTLSWQHDWHRRDASREGHHTVRLASPTRDAQRLGRLLAEHLQHIVLSAPVGDIGLHADEIALLPMDSQALFQAHGEHANTLDADALLTPAGRRHQRDTLLALLDRLGARLGPERVQQARIVPDHRLECAQVWQHAVPATVAPHSAAPLAREPVSMDKVAPWPQPSWILAQPLPLELGRDGLGEHPVYQGRLSLLAGPHRIEAGWWDSRAGHALVTRDYYLASSDRAGLLWIFRARHAPDAPHSPWFLHGFFA